MFFRLSFFVSLSFLFLLLTANPAYAWLDDFSYRKGFNVLNSTASDLTNYQTELTVYNATSTDSGSSVYLGNNVQSDFDDLRFTNSTGTTTLDYYISTTTSTYAKVWVELDSLSASATSTFYIYYGKASATASSTFADAFTALPGGNGDFETGDFTGWTTSDGYEGWGSKGTYTASISSTDPPEGNYWSYLAASNGDTQFTTKYRDVSSFGHTGDANINLVSHPGNITIGACHSPGCSGSNNYAYVDITLLYYKAATPLWVAFVYGRSYGTNYTELTPDEFNSLDVKTKIAAAVADPENYDLTSLYITSRHKYSGITSVYFDTIGFANYLTSSAPTLSTWESEQDRTNVVTYTAGTGGSISGSSTQSIVYEADATAVTAVADSGYTFSQWSDSSTDNPRTDTNITEALDISAVFTIIPPDDPVEEDTSGSVVLAPVSIGIGLVDSSIPMHKSRGVGEIKTSGTNLLMYIGSTAEFDSTTSNLKTNITHELKVIDLDINNKKIKIKIGSNILELKVEETKNVDLNNDNINDVSLCFNDLFVNRIDITVNQLEFEKNKQAKIIKKESIKIEKNKKPKISIIDLITKTKKRPSLNEKAFLEKSYDWKNIKIIDILLGGKTTNIKEKIKIPEKSSNAEISIKSNEQDNKKKKEVEVTVEKKEEIKKYLFRYNLAFGIIARDVKNLQEYLNNNGYEIAKSGLGSPGNETESFGRLTREALIRFQKANNLSPAIGFFGKDTRDFMNK